MGRGPVEKNNVAEKRKRRGRRRDHFLLK